MSISDNGQEFIDRETQLPADSREIGAGVVPGALDGVPLGNPAVDYDVRSTYDVRPVNGTDFTFSQVASPTPISESGAIWVFSFTVPKGFVAVVRWYQWAAQSPTGSITEWNDFLGSLQRNGVDFPYNTDVFLGPASKRMPVFMLADEEQTFGVRVVSQSIDSASMGQLTMYGNLLLKTGRAYPYEIANPVGVMRQTTLAPESLFQPPPVRELTREVAREAPPPVIQQPASPPPMAIPPFELVWMKQIRPRSGSYPAGGNMHWVPAVSIKGGRSSRDLTMDEARAYDEYIRTHRPT